MDFLNFFLYPMLMGYRMSFYIPPSPEKTYIYLHFYYSYYLQEVSEGQDNYRGILGSNQSKILIGLQTVPDTIPEDL